MKKRISILVMVACAIILAACGSNKEKVELLNDPYMDQQFLMGTYVRMQIFDEGKEDVLKTAFDRVKALADKITVNEKGSEIDKVNEASGIKPVKVSDDVYPLVKKAYQYSDEWNKGFDLSIGKITQLWHIGFDDARKPEQSEIDDALKLINYRDVELDDEKQTVFLKKKGMELDLGAIAKGYITDEVVKVMKNNDVTTAIIDLGGNVYVLGKSPRKSDGEWKVGIQDPNQARNTVVGSVTTSNKSLVTSGIYERNLTVNGETFHHLFSPKTGYPFENEIAGVSIISDKSIDGDGLSTSIFSMGLKEGMAHIDKLNNVEAIFVTKDDKVYISKGLEGNFELNKDSGYDLVKLEGK
ncbi:FAD:protein FMN transferase [Vagococcus sp. PNs007]|uniref:FAD:protein FMN transferase n=1 Tax=Vagococcus proximus TaxID=2991417 RepID=A0ABT5X1E1_9ENTE|nr:FAD:protein FMN transferase [Vagococcus proximus]MDF0479821.1 FAD:protein FMN transferase [Vagococcus proximus]